jgi:hypothetical protein
MRGMFIIAFLGSLLLKGQDKMFFRDGTVRTVTVVSVNDDQVYFREADQNGVQKIRKELLLMIEHQDSRTHVFAKPAPQSTLAVTGRRNMMGIQPFGLITGRATVAYERLSADERIGVVLPFTLTFNPRYGTYETVLDSSLTAGRNEVGFITGIDVNFYLGKKKRSRFFLGPRFRYGTDVFLQKIEGYTLQTQLGWRFGPDEGRLAQHLTFGFGFVKVLSTILGPFPFPARSFGWFSAGYRVSFRW